MHLDSLAIRLTRCFTVWEVIYRTHTGQILSSQTVKKRACSSFRSLLRALACRACPSHIPSARTYLRDVPGCCFVSGSEIMALVSIHLIVPPVLARSVFTTAMSIAVRLSDTQDAVQAHLLTASNKDLQSTAAKKGILPRTVFDPCCVPGVSPCGVGHYGDPKVLHVNRHDWDADVGVPLGFIGNLVGLEQVGDPC